MPETATVVLKPRREKPFLDNAHPWVMSGAVGETRGPADAPLARVETADGRPVGLGFHSPGSQIRVRLLGRGVEAADRAFFAARLAEAAGLRRAVLPAGTTGYRVLNAEGDGVPGWVVDRYGDVLVSQMTVAGLEALRDEAYAALTEAFPGLAVLHAGGSPARRAEGLAQQDETIAGEPPAEAEFGENGLRFVAELAGGQKTGFYLDQRENRRWVERLAAGRTVLDLFAHTGAFGLYALRGGAGSVTHVESSARLADLGRRQYQANGYAADAAEWRQANVFELLRQETGSWDLVVVDPPPLVRRRGHLEAGARAYKDLNRLALSRVAPGGFLLTFTCSGAVDSKLFRQVLFQASREARVRLELVAPLAAAPDHPVAATHPEGEYLKGWLGRVVGPDL
jgi:23S rRNA (cytosine1962-C5)-methyltransferase